MGVTSIKLFVNQTEYHVAFRKLEDQSDCGLIPPGYQHNNEVWIPWCDNPSQFSSKALIIEINEAMQIYVWQRGNSVYYYKSVPMSIMQPYVGQVKYPIRSIPNAKANPNIFNSGQLVPGASQVDGNRILRIVSYPNQNQVLRNYFDIFLEMC